jgi:hypothetical protein
MYDGGKIVPGVILFLGILFSPFLYSVGSGQAAAKPDIVLPTQSKQCVEPVEYMKDHHMQLLIQWRDDVVRNGGRIYVASDGKQYEESLTGTCLSSKCHSNKAEFCDRCHDYSNVQPNCWNCHTAPEGNKA